MSRWARSLMVRNMAGYGPSLSSRRAARQSTPRATQDWPVLANMRVRSEKNTTRVPCLRAYRSEQPRTWYASWPRWSRRIIWRDGERGLGNPTASWPLESGDEPVAELGQIL